MTMLGPTLAPAPRSSTHDQTPAALSSIRGPSYALTTPVAYGAHFGLQVHTTIRGPPSLTEPGSMVPSTDPDWLLMVLDSVLSLAAHVRLTMVGSALAPSHSSAHGRAAAALSSTTQVRPRTQPFPRPTRCIPAPGGQARLNHPPASPKQISHLWVCAPHRRVLDV